jgi:hypothetical protein
LRIRLVSKSVHFLLVTFFLLAQSFPAQAGVSFDEAAALLPVTFGDFRARGAATQPTSGIFELIRPEDFGVIAHAARSYASVRGETFGIEIIKTRSDSGAYALLLNQRPDARSGVVKLDGVGIAAFSTSSGVKFFKGQTFVSVYTLNKTPGNTESAINFARSFADTLDKGENEIPVLVKHLPEWETAGEHTLAYAVSLATLKGVVKDQPVLDAISFEGGTEAVTAHYGPSQLVIVEYTTPQLATANDARINERIKELRAAGGVPLPSAYKRVGNYSVFVFSAPDEKTAAQLMDGIKYEQVVQWLGDNPRAIQRAQRQYAETTAGVIVAVLKASGLALLLSLGIGGIFGTIIFRMRRKQQALIEAYSDAGGMVRLNLDEMTKETNPARLLGSGDR